MSFISYESLYSNSESHQEDVTKACFYFSSRGDTFVSAIRAWYITAIRYNKSVNSSLYSWSNFALIYVDLGLSPGLEDPLIKTLRADCLYRLLIIFKNFDDVSFMNLPSEALYPIKILFIWTGICNAKWWIPYNYFNGVTNPLVQALVHYRGDTTISMDPISSKEYAIWSFCINNKEGGRQTFASNRQLNIDCPPNYWRLSTKVY